MHTRFETLARFETLTLLVAMAALATAAGSTLHGLRAQEGAREEAQELKAELVRARSSLQRAAAEIDGFRRSVDGVTRLAERVYVRQRTHEQIHAIDDDTTQRRDPARSHVPR